MNVELYGSHWINSTTIVQKLKHICEFAAIAKKSLLTEKHTILNKMEEFQSLKVPNKGKAQFSQK